MPPDESSPCASCLWTPEQHAGPQSLKDVLVRRCATRRRTSTHTLPKTPTIEPVVTVYHMLMAGLSLSMWMNWTGFELAPWGIGTNGCSAGRDESSSSGGWCLTGRMARLAAALVAPVRTPVDVPRGSLTWPEARPDRVALMKGKAKVVTAEQ